MVGLLDWMGLGNGVPPIGGNVPQSFDPFGISRNPNMRPNLSGAAPRQAVDPLGFGWDAPVAAPIAAPAVASAAAPIAALAGSPAVVPAVSPDGLSGGAMEGAAPIRTAPVTSFPTTPINSAPTSGAGPAPLPAMRPTVVAPGPEGGGSLLDRIAAFGHRNSNALMGFGAGLASRGIGAGLAGLAAGKEADKGADTENMTAKVLRDKLGLTEHEALSAARTPGTMRQLLEKLYPTPKLAPTGQGLWGPQYNIVEGANVYPPNTPRVKSVAEAEALPRDTVFIDPQGTPRRVP